MCTVDPRRRISVLEQSMGYKVTYRHGHRTSDYSQGKNFLLLSVFSILKKDNILRLSGIVYYWTTCIPQTLIESLLRVIYQALFWSG